MSEMRSTKDDGGVANSSVVDTRETAKRVEIVLAAIAEMTIGSELAVEGARGAARISV